MEKKLPDFLMFEEKRMKPLEPDPQGLLSLKATTAQFSFQRESRKKKKKRCRKKKKDLLFIKLCQFLLICERVEKPR